MKHKILRFGLLAMILAPFLMSIAPAIQAAQCTLAGSVGNYGFTLTGVLITSTGPVPIAAVGRAHVNTSGQVSGTESRSVSGGFANETLSGTITIHPDCTGSRP
jgi:hypothetical protein